LPAGLPINRRAAASADSWGEGRAIMEPTAQLEILREIVLRTLAELGIPDADWSLVSQTSLLRDAEHPGRRFQFDGIRAIWFSDRSEIDFFAEDGRLLTSVTVPTLRVARPHAA
jgi:hypothetical protein